MKISLQATAVICSWFLDRKNFCTDYLTEWIFYSNFQWRERVSTKFVLRSQKIINNIFGNVKYFSLFIYALGLDWQRTWYLFDIFEWRWPWVNIWFCSNLRKRMTSGTKCKKCLFLKPINRKSKVVHITYLNINLQAT